jgi:hypothetical protein
VVAYFAELANREIGVPGVAARQPRKEIPRTPQTRRESLDEKYFRETRTAEKEAFSASPLKLYKKIPGSRLDTQGSFREGPPAKSASLRNIRMKAHATVQGMEQHSAGS